MQLQTLLRACLKIIPAIFMLHFAVYFVRTGRREQHDEHQKIYTSGSATDSQLI